MSRIVVTVSGDPEDPEKLLGESFRALTKSSNFDDPTRAKFIELFSSLLLMLSSSFSILLGLPVLLTVPIKNKYRILIHTRII